MRWAQELGRRYPLDPDAPTGVPNVLRTGQPVLQPEVSDEMLVASARDEEYLRLIREVGIRSVILVPLIAHERTLGVLTLIAAESGGVAADDEAPARSRWSSRAAPRSR